MTINYARYGQWSVAMDMPVYMVNILGLVPLPNELWGRRRRLVRARRLADEARSPDHDEYDPSCKRVLTDHRPEEFRLLLYHLSAR